MKVLKESKLSLKVKTLLSVGGFVVIFGVLLTLASLYDLEISKILTKGSLPAGNYYSVSQYGLFFEAFGSTPIWMAISVAAVIFFWNGPVIEKSNLKCNRRALAIAVMIASAIAVTVGFYFFISDLFKYISEHMLNKAYSSEGYVRGLKVALSVVLSVLLIFAWKNLGEERNKKLLRLAFVVILTALFYILITVIKSPIGRMRFRTMNAMGDTNFQGFTDWFVINGKRTVANFPSDSCKSFPSGHTFSAGVIFVIVSLPEIFKKLDKTWIKVLLWVVAIGYTGAVALSRIIVGAHFFSDVLFGGTIAFGAAMIAKEIFVSKGAHLKCFMKQKASAEIDGESTPKNEDNSEATLENEESVQVAPEKETVDISAE